MLDQTALMKALSPRLVNKLVNSFDRASTVIVSSCWAAAIIMMVFTIYTLSLVSKAHREAGETMAIEPILPTIARDPIDKAAAATMLDRLKKRYPDLVFDLGSNNLKVSSNDGSKFRQWLMALSYIETISPEYQWSIQSFCAGKCKNTLMFASLQAERISFKIPTDKK